MKIAFFTDTYYPDLNGVTVSVSNFAKQLRKNGHKVHIFAPKMEGKYKDKDKDLVRLPSLRLLSKTEPQIYTPTIWPNKEFREMFTEDFDIIHAHGNGPYSLLGYSIGKIKRTPFVMTFHTIHTHYTHYIFNGKIITPKMVSVGLKTFAHRCALVITPSEKMKKELVSYGVKKQIHVIPNFLESDRFRKSKKGYLRKLLGLPKDAPILLTVGRIGKEKNIDFILKVFKEVAKTDTKSHLVIVGRGPESDNLITLSKKLGIDKRVHFTGSIDYEFMPQVYKDATIFVFASYTETQGVCVLEAAATGVPLVINNDGAFKGMVDENENGYILPLNIGRFSEKIIYLLKNKEIREKMGKRATVIAEKNFDASRITEELIKIYSKLLLKKDN